MKSIANILSVLGLATKPNPIALDLEAIPNPIAFGLAAQPDPIALGMATELVEILKG